MPKRKTLARGPTGRFLSKADASFARKEKKARGPLTKKQKRAQTIRAAYKERHRRVRSKGRLKKEYRKLAAAPVVKRSGGKGWRKKVTTYRVAPTNKNLAQIADLILKAKSRSKVQVQVGRSYQLGTAWAGTRLTDKKDASIWLQSLGQSYAKRWNKTTARTVVVEVLELEAVKPTIRRARHVTKKTSGASRKRSKGARR
jgi:hypothetical protein